jgi:putative endonuclease
MKRRDTGILGEGLAVRHLEQKGYRILERNHRCREGEIDIVAGHAGCLVFVEVRCRRGTGYGSPEESVVPTQMAKLRACAAYYLQEKGNQPPSWRIDVVAIELDGHNRISRIEHIENAVEEG